MRNPLKKLPQFFSFSAMGKPSLLPLIFF